MSTKDGSDIQDNFFSSVPTGCGIGIGGPDPISLPAGSYPADGLYEPQLAASDLGKQLGMNPTLPGAYDAILKLGNGLCHQNLSGISVAQGYEDSLNLNFGTSMNIISGIFSTTNPPGLRVITIKGGSNGNVIKGALSQHGTGTDVKLGDWSDETYDYSVNNDLSLLTMGDGSKVRVTIGHAKGTKLPQNCKVLIFRSLFLKTYWWVKWLTRKARGIPVGTPGPSWLA